MEDYKASIENYSKDGLSILMVLLMWAGNEGMNGISRDCILWMGI
jgi:hypothetical protein